MTRSWGSSPRGRSPISSARIPSPVFRAYVVGQEGEWRPNLVGLGPTIQRWYQSAIEKLTAKLGLGTPVYHNHMPTNREKNRPAIGEIVGKAMVNLQGMLSSLAVAYIYPQYRSLPLDVASIEADVMVPQDVREFDVKDVDVKRVVGIALGNSQLDKPASPGATLIAQLQAFAEKPETRGGLEKMTLEEIKKAIQEGGHKPSDLFPLATLTSDPYVKEHVEEKINNAKGYDIRKRQDLEKEVETLKAEKATLQGELASSKTSVIKTKAREAFDAILKERPKLTTDPKLVKFVQRSFDKGFTPKDEAGIKDELNKFVDSQVTEFQELFGEQKSEEKPGGEKKPDAGNPPTADASLEELKKSDLFPKD